MGGGHAHFLSHLLEHQVEGLDKIQHHSLSNSISILLMASSAAIAIFALYFSYLKWGKTNKEIIGSKAGIWQSLSSNRLYIDELYNAIIVKPTEKIAAWGEYLIEKIILSQIIQWIGTSLQWSGSLLIRFQKGTVNQYIFWMIFATLLFFLYTSLTIHLWN
jgi:NADH-quinone oxidoreductase subunit L